MSKVEAVIFDWAGTTVDYGCFAPVYAFIEVFKSLGIEPTVEEVRKPMGMRKKDHIRMMMEMPRIKSLWLEKQGKDWNEGDIDKVYEKSEREIMNRLSGFLDIKPYVVETVKELKKRGIKIGSTTGYTDEMMEVVVPLAKEAGYNPDFWMSPDGVKNLGRPYPYMIFENLKKLKIKSVKNAIKIGDTESDIEEGKNAGMISVGVIEGSSIMGLSQKDFLHLTEAEKSARRDAVRKVFEKAGADYVIDNMSQLIGLIESI